MHHGKLRSQENVPRQEPMRNFQKRQCEGVHINKDSDPKPREFLPCNIEYLERSCRRKHSGVLSSEGSNLGASRGYLL